MYHETSDEWIHGIPSTAHAGDFNRLFYVINVGSVSQWVNGRDNDHFPIVWFYPLKN